MVIVHLEWVDITEGAVGNAVPFTILVAASILIASADYQLIGFLVACANAIAAFVTKPTLWRPLGVGYASLMGLSIVVLRYPALFGFEATVFLLVIVWATDIGAYFAGRTIGGPKLWPAISPKKTWAGAAGGLLGALVAGLVVASLTSIPTTAPLMAVIVLLSISSQYGDLFESFIKRRFGAKDSGNLIPGHGGMMDRLDGLAFASVTAVVIGVLHGGPGAIAAGLVQW